MNYFLRLEQIFRPKAWVFQYLLAQRMKSTSAHGFVAYETRPPVDALLIDVSGNLHVGTIPTAGAVDAFESLMNSSIPFRLCSNTSKESTADLVKRLDDMGFKVTEATHALSRAPFRQKYEDDQSVGRRLVWTSIGAVAQAVKNMGLKAPYLLLNDSARAEVLASRDWDEMSDPSNRNYDCVVVGLAPSFFDYEHLNTAFRILKGEMQPPDISTSQAERRENERSTDKPVQATTQKIPLIATHRAKYIQSGSGQLSLGPGPFVAALECAAGPGVQAHVVGKPTRAFFKMVIDDFGFEANGECVEEGVFRAGQGGDGPIRRTRKGKIVVIGDDVEADLGGGAVELGLWRVLVKTGKYRPGDENRAGIVPPDEVCDSFGAFVKSLLRDSRDRPEHSRIS
ncbi:unnamed protein product [Cyclocybe aegerita]|uniref:Haloacid dehalogenase-like hydrolase domain-containing protein 2 n=1 Tax=Cyclocybe aegerita TaxID=1973307 RepID=A0A8S0WG95_CYCAE|nr:unnamed protein product [Cyclocybe aegerita]